jgi:bcr-type benzoyl-CoA reductase subunit D
MSITAGVDVGSSAIKAVIMSNENGSSKLLGKEFQRIRRRNALEVSRTTFNLALAQTDLKEKDIEYIASTGEGDLVDFKTGHFYGMTTHARGAKFLYDDTATVTDIGALHQRAITIDEGGRVLKYKMTGQCASCSGQFVENIVRYLGVRIDEVGELALQATNPQRISSVCAVLGETDVINMVSRQHPISDILMGILESIASRLTKLLSGIHAKSPVTLTGGLALNAGMIKAVQTMLDEKNMKYKLRTHEDSIYAGAIGAAIWSDYRLKRISK